MAMKKRLLLVPLTLCLLLLVAAAQDTDTEYEDEEYEYEYDDEGRPERILTVNGTVQCPDNPSADVEYASVGLLLFDSVASGGYSVVDYQETDSRGRFRFVIREGSRNADRVSPGFRLELNPPRNPTEPCPEGLTVDAFGRVRWSSSRFIGVYIFPNGTRDYAWVS